MQPAGRWIDLFVQEGKSMNNERNFWAKLGFKAKSPHCDGAGTGHEICPGMVHKAFPQCLGSTILGDSPQSKLIYIASPYAGDITGNT